MSNEHLYAAQHLADVLAQENEALKRLDFTLAATLLPAKDAAFADLIKQPNIETPPATLAAVGQRLAKLASENQILLERAIAVQTRVVRIVARALAPPAAATRYNGYDGRASSARTTALAVSTRA
jgi:hypothetical protein